MLTRHPSPVAVTGPWVRRYRGVGALVLVSAVLNGLCAASRFWTLRNGTYDLVIFDQAVRSYSQFHLPVAFVKGVHNGFGPDFAVLGDHFSPILALLAPLYWIHDGPATLLVAQSVLLALAVVPLWVLARRELGIAAAYAVAGAYVVSWPIAQAAAFDFHEVAFAPLITALLFERLSAWRRGTARSDRLWPLLVIALALLCVKEDMGLLLAGIGVALAVRGPLRERVLGLGFAVGGLGATALATSFLIPAFGGRADYYWTYGRLGEDPPAVVWHLVSRPLDSLGVFLTPDAKWHTLLWLLALGALAPLASPYVLSVLPLLAERMLADSPNWWATDYHYNAFLVVPLLCAGIDGAARIARRVGQTDQHGGRTDHGSGRAHRWVGPGWAVAALLAGVLSVPSFAFGGLADRSSWEQDADAQAAIRAAARIPDGELVEAVNEVGPRLSGRTRVLLWDRIQRDAPWVLADVSRPRFPFCSLADQRARVSNLQREGYVVVYAERGYVVLHREVTSPQLVSPPSAPCAAVG